MIVTIDQMALLNANALSRHGFVSVFNVSFEFHGTLARADLQVYHAVESNLDLAIKRCIGGTFEMIATFVEILDIDIIPPASPSHNVYDPSSGQYTICGVLAHHVPDGTKSVVESDNFWAYLPVDSAPEDALEIPVGTQIRLRAARLLISPKSQL